LLLLRGWHLEKLKWLNGKLLTACRPRAAKWTQACSAFCEGLLELCLSFRGPTGSVWPQASCDAGDRERESAGRTDLLRRACFGGSRDAKTFAAVRRAGDVLLTSRRPALASTLTLFARADRRHGWGGYGNVPTFSRHAKRRGIAACGSEGPVLRERRSTPTQPASRNRR
jgi:hypothetical protein